jgi:hypothetical protein
VSIAHYTKQNREKCGEAQNGVKNFSTRFQAYYTAFRLYHILLIIAIIKYTNNTYVVCAYCIYDYIKLLAAVL